MFYVLPCFIPYSVCDANFSEPPNCVNVFLNKFLAFFVAPFRIFAKCERAAQIPDDFASFLGIARGRMTPNWPAFPLSATTTEQKQGCSQVRDWPHDEVTKSAQPEELPESSPLGLAVDNFTIFAPSAAWRKWNPFLEGLRVFVAVVVVKRPILDRKSVV